MGFSFNVLTASPGVARGSLGAIGERIDGCAHDCWGVGCMAFRAFANLWPFYCPPTGSQEQDYVNLRNSHNSWVRQPFFTVLECT